MADYRRYQPRRSSSQGGGWRRWFVIGGAIVLIIVIARFAISGRTTRNENSVTTNNTTSGITLLTDNTNSTVTNTQTPAASTNSWEGFSTLSCPSAMSSFGTTKQIILTIGFSSANESVNKVLDSLKQAGVQADFFVSGSFAAKNPEVVKSVSQAGYAVYSQSYDSTDLTTLSDDQLKETVSKTETAIVTATGVSPKPIIRPPAGSYTAATIKLLRELGYCAVLWTVDAYDWQDGITVEQSKERVMTAVKKQRGGSIVALHAGYDITPQLITDLVSTLKTQGYEVMTLASILNP